MAHHNIVLTGLPRSGKSTLLQKIILSLDNTHGFMTLEVRDGNERKGFEISTSDGRHRMLASVDIDSPLRVSRYGVDIAGLDETIEPLFSFSRDQILYIDEIGQMELYSQRFIDLARTYLDAKNPLIATMSSVYQHGFIEEVRLRKDVVIFDITPENRVRMYEEIRSLPRS